MVALHLVLSTGNDLLLVASTVVGVLAVAWYSLRQFRKELGSSKSLGPTTASMRSLLLKYVVTTSIATLSGITSLFILAGLVAPQQPPTLLAICTIGVVVANFLVAVQFRQKPARAVVTSIVAAMTLMICGENLATQGLSQSERIMAGFGIGEASRVSLEVTGPGAARLHENGLDPSELALLSRLGDEYLVGGTTKDNKSRRVALKKDMVKSWSSVVAAPPERTFLSQSPDASKRWLDVLDWAFVGLTLLWMVWEVSRDWPNLKSIFSNSGTVDSAPNADDVTSRSRQHESVVFVEIDRTISVTTELSES